MLQSQVYREISSHLSLMKLTLFKKWYVSLNFFTWYLNSFAIEFDLAFYGVLNLYYVHIIHRGDSFRREFAKLGQVSSLLSSVHITAFDSHCLKVHEESDMSLTQKGKDTIGFTISQQVQHILLFGFKPE